MYPQRRSGGVEALDRVFGSCMGAWMTFQSCYVAVERKLRAAAKSCVPASERKPPENFGLSCIMRPSCSA